MIEMISSLLVILNVGSLVMLAFLMFANPFQANKKANRWLGISFLLWASFWTEEVLFMIGAPELNSVSEFVLRSLQYLTPLMLYYAIMTYSNPDYQIKKTAWGHLISPISYVIALSVFHFRHADNELFHYLLIIALFGQSLFYLGIAYLRIRKHQKSVLKFSSDTRTVNLFWLEKIIMVTVGILLISVFYNIFFTHEHLNFSMNLIFLSVICYVGYHSMKQKEIYPFTDSGRKEVISLQTENTNEKPKIKLVSDEELASLKTQLNQFMLEKKPYLDASLNLVKLAELFEITPHRLSYLINSGFDKNFFSFINSYRVEEVKVLLQKRKNEQYSLLGIAFESGFNSKTTFNNTFKKLTGQTPTEYIKSCSDL